jgi:hypothetical protein
MLRRLRRSPTTVELEPQVTITKKDGETVEEARVNGKLMWVKGHPEARAAILSASGSHRRHVDPARRVRSRAARAAVGTFLVLR